METPVAHSEGMRELRSWVIGRSLRGLARFRKSSVVLVGRDCHPTLSCYKFWDQSGGEAMTERFRE